MGRRGSQAGAGRRQSPARVAVARPDGPVARLSGRCRRSAISSLPGPTPVPPEVLAALAEPVIHHRSPDFKAVFSEMLARLREVFRTENEVLVFTASGTGAFESAFVNLLSPGEKVLVVSHGEFGSRWQKLAAAFGCDVVAADLRLGPRRRSPRTSPARWPRAAPRVALPRALGDLDRRRLRHPLARRRLQRRGRDLGRRCDLEPRRGSARNRRLGDRRRRHRLAEGPDDAARPRVRLRLRAGLGEGRSRRRCRGSTGTGRGRARARRRAARRSRPPPRRWSR